MSWHEADGRERARRATPLDTDRDRLALFRTVLAALDSSPEMHDVLQRALRSVIRFLGSEFGGMVLLDDARHPGMIVAASYGLPEDSLPGRVFRSDCQCGQIGVDSLPTLSPECSQCQCGIQPPGWRHRHFVVPLKVRQMLVGALCIYCPHDFHMEVEEFSFWEDLGIQIGHAVDQAQLQAQVDRERELLHILYEMSDHLATSLDLEWVLDKVLDLSLTATDASDGSIFLLPGPGGRQARILRRDLAPAEADLAIEQVLTRGLAGWVVRHKEAAIVPDVARDPRWLSFAQEPYPIRSALAVPLVATGNVLGVITATSARQDHFHVQQLAIVTAIADQAAVAIEKARLHSEVIRLADRLAQRVEEQTQELKEIQAQLIQAEKLAALGELAAGVAHEINNPLHILQAYVYYMGDHLVDNANVLEVLEPMGRALDSIARLATQLRDFSRPSSGEWKAVDLNQALERVLRLVGKELMHCHVSTHEFLTPGLPPIMGDARQIEQVFLNLILNARDAMPGGGQLTVETRADADVVHVRIADTGSGISREHLPRIFEPYFTTKADRGTGLGLAICQRIVSQHGGKIDVNSELGRGTVFGLQFRAALGAT